jgi:hypothetical protein
MSLSASTFEGAQPHSITLPTGAADILAGLVMGRRPQCGLSMRAASHVEEFQVDFSASFGREP